MPDDQEPGAYLRATLASQPRELSRLLSDDSATVAAERLRGCSRIFVVGTGTSYHGALAGQFILRSAGIEAWAVRAFEFANYPPTLREGDGLILLSHRGSKHFSRRSLDLAEQRAMPWLAVTGEGSALEGEGVVRTVEQEKSPVHTASHTGAMLRLAQIAAALGKPPWRGQLAGLPEAVAAVLEWGDRVAADVRRVELKPVVHFVGGGPARATAYEGALKMREASHLVSAEGHDVEGILHGPLVSIQPGQTVVAIAEPGPALERTREVIRALGEIGAVVIQVGSVTDGYRTTRVDEVLAPIVNVVPLQLLAYEASRLMGVDADSFRRDEPPYAAAQAGFTL
ncbi:MAG: SIS domain-containing protein [Chloroflexi bacterium]|nr:MAG: SIS domain-containing protein [Chloroflexota bacterium]